MGKLLCCLMLFILFFATDGVCSEPATNTSLPETSVMNISDPEPNAQLNYIKETLAGHRMYSEYIKTIDSQIFQDYVNELPSSQFRETKQILNNGSQEDIVELINNYEKQKNYQESKRSMILRMIEVHNDPYYMRRRISYEKGILYGWLRKMEVNSDLSHFRLEKIGHFSYFLHYATVKNKTEHEYLYEIDTLTNTFRAVEVL